MGAIKENRTLSYYQVSIMEHLKNKCNLVIEARAGSGKTTTIVEAIRTLPIDSKILCVAFNKTIAEELKNRLPAHVQTSTINALGHRLLRSYYGGDSVLMIRKLEETINETYSKLRVQIPKNELVKLTRDAVIYGYFPEKFNVHYGIDFKEIFTDEKEDAYINECKTIVDEILIQYVNNQIHFDYDDQIYSTLALGIQVAQKYDYIFVDEAQDLSFLKMKLTFNFLSSTGKYIAIGDSCQAIYEFAGAQENSLSMIQKEMNCDILKLPVSYRCPKTVIKLAQKYVPDIVAAENAVQGMIEKLNIDNFIKKNFHPNSLVLCRNNGPLFTLAFKMFNANRLFRYDRFEFIKKQILDFIMSPKKNSIIDTLKHYDAIKEEISKQIDKESDEKKRMRKCLKLDEISEYYEILHTIYTETKLSTVHDLIKRIEEFNCTNSGPMLCTVHKSKGLEAEDVYILDEKLFKLTEKQEQNLYYVAVTRSRQNLFFI